MARGKRFRRCDLNYSMTVGGARIRTIHFTNSRRPSATCQPTVTTLRSGSSCNDRWELHLIVAVQKRRILDEAL